ncbi:MAG: proline--tRNA ligase, partial [Spirochaetia bacterium]|nr:proline--tRNA ligase [Spirochaetia bacterium]
MRASSFLIATLRDDPAEAQVASHRLMLRAGLVRKQGAGLYHVMPMGLRVLRKIEAAVREEMNAAGAVEFQLPILTPSELWEKSGRWSVMGKEMFRLKDRHDVWNALGPTHEESFTDLVKDLVKSYRDLPINVYQIHTKFRDEIRPRFGVIRSREFSMKDAYSFDLNEAGLDKTYEKMRAAYRQIFARVGLKTIPVEADTGAMGGTGSEEFMIASEIGEETLLISEGGQYKSNQEKTPVVYGGGVPAGKSPAANVSGAKGNAAAKKGAAQTSGEKKSDAKSAKKSDAKSASLTKVSTPNCPGIEDVAKFLKVEPTAILKTLVYKADDGFAAAMLRGDRQINEVKLKNKTGAVELRAATPEEIESLGTVAGYIGPQGIPETVAMFWDMSLSTGQEWVVGANDRDHHCTGYMLPDGLELVDLALAVAGDPSPAGDGKLTAVKGIEVGHIFKLGDKYTKAFDVKVLDEGGRPVTPLMGCYGIGVTRTIAAIIEQ